MSKYLNRLRALDGEKRLPWQPSKPSKAPFEGFEGDRGTHISTFGPRRSMVFPVPRPRVVGPTDRFCDCGQLATFAYPDSAGRDVWRCLDCLAVHGRA